MSNLSVGPIKYVVLICEEALEPLVAVDIIAAGAKGYTVCTVRGRGNRGVRDAQWLLSSNIRIEILCSEASALKIVETVEKKYSENFGLVIFIQDVVGPRSEKY